MRVFNFHSLCAIASTVAATRTPISHSRTPVPPPLAADDVTLYNETTFEQLIDHDDPSLGTFLQRYWWNAEFYAGPGSPVSDKGCHCLIVMWRTLRSNYWLIRELKNVFNHSLICSFGIGHQESLISQLFPFKLLWAPFFDVEGILTGASGCLLHSGRKCSRCLHWLFVQQNNHWTLCRSNRGSRHTYGAHVILSRRVYQD